MKFRFVFLYLILFSFLFSVRSMASLGIPSPAVLVKICQGNFAKGKFSQVALWRSLDKTGVVLYQLIPDTNHFKHPPHFYYNEQGTEKLTVPEKPFNSNSQKDQELQKKIKDLTSGLEKSEIFFCDEILNRKDDSIFIKKYRQLEKENKK